MSEEAPSQPPLRVRSLTRAFGGVRALDGVSFSVEQGRVLAVIGPNGSGKTTLFNLVSGVLGPSDGSVYLWATEVGGWSVDRVARLGMSRTFQEVRLFRGFTVAENVIYALGKGRREGIGDILRLRSLKGLRGELYDEARSLLGKVGLQDKLDAPATALSYGQSKLVELVRALATSPRLLLLDEPTAGLSPAAIDAVLGLLQPLPGSGMTIVFIEHNLSVVQRLATAVVVLDAGKVISQGSPEEVRSDPRVEEAYFGRRSE